MGGTVGWRLLCCIEGYERYKIKKGREGTTDSVYSGRRHSGRMREESCKGERRETIEGGFKAGPAMSMGFPTPFPPASPFSVGHFLAPARYPGVPQYPSQRGQRVSLLVRAPQINSAPNPST